MPSKTVELAILDTSVYIENFRTGRFIQRTTESPFLFRGVSVVIHELLRGVRRPEEREFALTWRPICDCTRQRSVSGWTAGVCPSRHLAPIKYFPRLSKRKQGMSATLRSPSLQEAVAA